jgi:N-acetyl-gamma-glutamyl-phosphate reductase
MKTLGLVGARGYVGREVVEIVTRHPKLELALSVSQRDNKSAEEIAGAGLDAYVLALPNGKTAPYVEAITRVRPDAIIVDLSADHRFDDTWVYGQPERLRERVRAARRIANPGCYATAMQLALAPLAQALDGPANVFGVSGYSGAGTTPSPKNDPEVLRDNLVPYALAGHVHEREVKRQLACGLFFMPHVAPFFRGITCTVSVALREVWSKEDLRARFEDAYRAEPLVHVTDDPPLVRDVAGKHDVFLGGLTLSDDGRHAVLVANIDNLLGGAATQAIRNLNLALGEPELLGIDDAAAH